MKVRVRLFAILRERAGRDEVELALDVGAKVADALAALSEIPGLDIVGLDVEGRLPALVAVNREYADPDTDLSDGDELALIPPVSGGAGLGADRGSTSRSRAFARVRDEPLSLTELSERVSRSGAGAVVCFQGVTREVARLEYEAYREMAEERMLAILEECLERHSAEAAAAEHRVGSVGLGEPGVIVCISAAHREEAFAAAREAIDRIKAEAPIWKREVESDGSARWAPGQAPAGSNGPIPAGAGGETRLTHLDEQGRARMVDVGKKPMTERRARARARLRMSPATARAVEAGKGPKGEVLGVARLAAIQAAKHTATLIPLAHPIALSYVEIEATVDVDSGLVELVAEARTVAQTGVEMEAMTACSVAALTVYDMVKGVERGVEIEQVVLLEKTGGRSDWRRPAGPEPNLTERE